MFAKSTVLITGASTGIGYDLAHLFGESKANLILVARNEAKLDEMCADFKNKYSIEVQAIGMDLAQSGAAAKLVEEVNSRGLTVDYLVNNAGYGVYGNFNEEKLEPQMGMIHLHVETMTYLTHVFIQGMLKRGKGGVMNVASTAGFQALPLENIYGATKAYIVSFTEALAEELRGGPLKISCLCPGPTQTPFFDNPLLKSWQAAKMPRMNCKEVADFGFEAFKKGKVLAVPGFMNKMLIFGNRFAPRAILVRVVKKIIEKPVK